MSWAALASGRAPYTQPSRPETGITKNHRAGTQSSASNSRNNVTEGLIHHRLDSFESVIRNLQEENARLRKEIAVLKGEAPSATLPPLPTTPVSAESVKNAEEVMEVQDAQPAHAKRKALDPQQAEAKSQQREEKLRERVEALEDKVVGMLAQQPQQNAQLNGAIAQQTAQTEQLASAIGQLTQMVASLQARIDDIEMRLPGGAGRPLRATGKPYLRPAANEEAQDQPDGKQKREQSQ